MERSAVSFGSHVDSKALISPRLWSAAETVPFVHQADPEMSLPFRQQPINRTNLIFFGTILLKAINKLNRQKTTCTANLDSSEVQPSLRDSISSGRSHTGSETRTLQGKNDVPQGLSRCALFFLPGT